MKRKPLSLDQKREKMLQIFHEAKEVFNLKEIEKHSTKKGIVLQTVKDVLMGLISDNLVDSEKIGSANFYWSLPSKTYQTLITKNSEVDQKLEKLKQQREQLEKDIELSKEDKEESEQRTKNLKLLEELKNEHSIKEKLIRQFQRNDPERKAQLEDDQDKLKQKTNYWIDNLQEIKSFLKNKFLATDEDIENQFDIPADLDNI